MLKTICITVDCVPNESSLAVKFLGGRTSPKYGSLHFLQLKQIYIMMARTSIKRGTGTRDD